MPAKITTSHTCALTPGQVEILRAIVDTEGWTKVERPYTIFAAEKDKTQISVYEKGPKLLAQGKGVGEFVEFVLEPRVLGAAIAGYEEIHHPELFEPHIGIDESGKGDFFGPLVIAAVHTDRAVAKTFLQAGVADSKTITSDKRVKDLATLIKETPGAAHTVISIGPTKYNELYAKFRNLNRLLAWGHARALESVLEQKPDCPKAISDQFASPTLLRRALMERGKQITLVSRTKAEADVAVAAASILARERFINWLSEAGRKLGVTLPRGASGAVNAAAKSLAKARGGEFLRDVAKVHFRTAHAVAPDVYPPPPPKKPFVRGGSTDSEA